MKHRYAQILALYLHNPAFVPLVGVFLAAAFLSKVVGQAGHRYYAEEIFTLLFVVSLWLAFHFGILLKWQFSTHRASLLPRHRSSHIHCVFVLYAVFALVVYLWESGLGSVMEISRQGLWGVYWTCLWTSVCITFLGYLSMGRVLIYAYVVLLVFAHQSFNVISVLDDARYLAYAIAAACGVFIIFFRVRLMRIKEDSFEYGPIFSWPPRNFILGQLRASQRIDDLAVGPLAGLMPRGKEVAAIPTYARTGNIFVRAYHWGYAERRDLKMIWVWILLAAPFVLLLLNNQAALQNFDKNMYSNLLLLSITPVLIAIGANYKRLAYGDHDVLRPVDKKQYVREQGVILAMDLISYWTLFAACFFILPGVFFDSSVLGMGKFWAYLIFTVNFSFLVLCWLVLLSGISNATTVIVHGGLLGFISLFYFYFSSSLSFEQMILSNWMCLVGNAILTNRAYRAWCEKEFSG